MNKTLSFCLSLLFALVCSSLKAQETYKPGFVILNDNTRISGLITLNTEQPWTNQRHIYMKDSTSLAAGAEKDVKAKKYRFDDLKSYEVGGRVFEKVHYMDMSKLQVKNLGANDHMLEKLATGKITVYRYYAYLDDMYAGTQAGVEAEIQQDKDASKRLWKMLIKKEGDNNFKDAFAVDLQKYFEDTPAVLQKYQKGEYGNKPKKKGLGAKMVGLAMQASGLDHLEADAMIAAFNDYNKENRSK